jgi:hypothetical protein
MASFKQRIPFSHVKSRHFTDPWQDRQCFSNMPLATSFGEAGCWEYTKPAKLKTNPETQMPLQMFNRCARFISGSAADPARKAVICCKVGSRW